MSSERGWRAAGYLDLDVRIGQASGGAYLVEADSPVGEASETTRFSDDPADLEGRLQALRTVLRGTDELTASGRQLLPGPVALAPEGERDVRAFGQHLFEALLPTPVRGVYERSRQAADDQGQGLRLRLRIRDPRLAALPWEFLYDPHRQAYLCRSRRTSVVRRVESPRPVPAALRVAPPLRVLGMAALPPDQKRLDAAGERAWVEAALTPLIGRHEAELRWVEGQTWRALQQSLRQGPWHVFHFVGHGGFDPRTGAGYLALVDENGGPYRLSAADLAGLIGELDELRLVVLNTCLGARGSREDVFSSVAAQLVHTGAPAVVAMQYEISDTAAKEFARTFYAAVVGPHPGTSAAGARAPLAVDAAVAEAREAMRLAAPQTLEWATPVLYLRAPDAVLFDLHPQSAQAPAGPPGRSPVPARVLLIGAALTLVAVAVAVAMAALNRPAGALRECTGERPPLVGDPCSIRATSMGAGGVKRVQLPGDYDDSSIAVDAWLRTDTAGQYVAVACRDSGEGAYVFVVEPGRGEFQLTRFGRNGQTRLVEPRLSPAIRRDNARNQLDLRCQGDTISASINGTEVVDVTDQPSPGKGAIWFGVGRFVPGADQRSQSAEAPVEGHFEALRVAGR